MCIKRTVIEKQTYFLTNMNELLEWKWFFFRRAPLETTPLEWLWIRLQVKLLYCVFINLFVCLFDFVWQNKEPTKTKHIISLPKQ